MFQCRDEGPLRSEVTWRRGNGLPLPPGSRDNNGRLEMPNIQVYLMIRMEAKIHSPIFQISDTGTFICFARGFPPSTPGAEVSVYLLVEQREYE